MQKWQVYILNLALAFTFFAMALKAFFSPDEISDPINNSVIFKDILDKIPISLIGIHDAIIGLLLALRIFPKLINTWAAIWVGTVIILLITSMTVAGLLDAIEHTAPLGIALYLSLNAFISQKAGSG